MAERLNAEERTRQLKQANQAAECILKEGKGFLALDLLHLTVAANTFKQQCDLIEAENTRLQAEKEHLGTELADAVAQCVQLEKVEEDLTWRLQNQKRWTERWVSAAAQNEADLLLARAEVEQYKADACHRSQVAEILQEYAPKIAAARTRSEIAALQAEWKAKVVALTPPEEDKPHG